ncbi:hypothetical protein [Undibacterium sp. Tian12W]|uniref:hypothetical protein n=1 Tax=Undibacterium sp. Tian12W TaxID=3413054 RepID=UPI003BEF8161
MRRITAQAFDLNNKNIGKQFADVEFFAGQAASIIYKNESYYPSGKTGTNIRTGEYVQELNAKNDSLRIWINKQVTIIWED